VGEHLTMADIVLAHTLRWAIAFEFPVTHDNLNAFLARMEQRPAFARMLQTKGEEIPR